MKIIAALLLDITLMTSSRATQSEDEAKILALVDTFYTGIETGQEISHEFDFYTVDGVLVWNGTEVKKHLSLQEIVHINFLMLTMLQFLTRQQKHKFCICSRKVQPPVLGPARTEPILHRSGRNELFWGSGSHTPGPPGSPPPPWSSPECSPEEWLCNSSFSWGKRSEKEKMCENGHWFSHQLSPLIKTLMLPSNCLLLTICDVMVCIKDEKQAVLDVPSLCPNNFLQCE